MNGRASMAVPSTTSMTIRPWIFGANSPFKASSVALQAIEPPILENYPEYANIIPVAHNDNGQIREGFVNIFEDFESVLD